MYPPKNTSNKNIRKKPVKRPPPQKQRMQQQKRNSQPTHNNRKSAQPQLPQRRKPAQLPPGNKMNKSNNQLARINSQYNSRDPRKINKDKQKTTKNNNKAKPVYKGTKKDAIKKAKLNATQLLPILDYLDDGETGFLCKNEVYMNIFRINNKDYMNMSDNETKLDIAYWERIYRTIEPANFKILITNMPNNVSECRDYLRRECKKVKEPIYVQMLKEEIAELEKLEKGEYKQPYLFIYLKKYDALVNYNGRILRALCDTGIAQEIDVTEKLAVLNKLNCPHTYDTQKYFELLIE